MKRKPTRRDLLIVINRLQGLVGSIGGTAGDRNPNRAAQLDALQDVALNLCIEALSQDPPVEPSGPWADLKGEDGRWRRAG